ncbi:outer membrane protein assembly factor BamE [Sulfitobacter sp. SK011]|uniref:outer membrane protein assembly factor BamE n=1 Tax=Sulfitobacter sp. SK011 TaxID=1389004 RepID=UPI000E0C8A40|nr:outer membrane protein assembly factor BamE [Sulfitobacter sp. SK011]AXI42699.1 outer membrane protein assembly factor BamE [Sulfitobacter sp. SK011]
MRIKSQTRVRAFKATTFAAVLALAACSPQFENHGYIPPQEDLDQIQVGTDTRESVTEKVGVPTSAGVLSNSGFYYVKMRQRVIGPLAPKEIDRQVVAISFSDNGVVTNVERFGLERGRVVPLSRRVTSSSVRDQSLLRQLLGNIGRFSPAFGS